MREFLENVEKGSEDESILNPLKSAQKGVKPQLPKRFYKNVEAVEKDDYFTIQLDGKNIKTPGKNPVELPTMKLAKMIAIEWDAQEKEINPMDMPATRLVNTAIDGITSDPQAILEDIVKFVGSDLLCYRADSPKGLVESQEKHWDPMVDWASESLGAHFELAMGVLHTIQPKEALAIFGVHLKRHNHPIALAALHTFTSLTGSAILALALAEEEITPETAWTAAHVDEDWQISLWGEDFDAEARRKKRWIDMKSAHEVFIALKG